MNATCTMAQLALAAMRSANRLDRLRAVNGAPPLILHQERVLLERRCLRLLDAVRHMDDPRWHWEQEGLA